MLKPVFDSKLNLFARDGTKKPPKETKVPSGGYRLGDSL